MEDDGGTAATAEERTRYLLDTVRVHALIGGAERECSVSDSGRVSTVDLWRLAACSYCTHCALAAEYSMRQREMAAVAGIPIMHISTGAPSVFTREVRVYAARSPPW